MRCLPWGCIAYDAFREWCEVYVVGTGGCSSGARLGGAACRQGSVGERN